MGLNNNTQGLIKAVAENDIQKAKKYVQAILASETAEKNQWFKNQILTKLSSPQSNLLELPYNLKGLLQLEDVSISFNENRYYLSEREKAIFDKINALNKTCHRLSELRIRYINSTLLYGESGTGKTTFGRYVAYKLGIPFAYISFSSLIGSHLGETGKSIKTVFDHIKSIPCVLMLDELDAIGESRHDDGSSAGKERNNIVIGLMQAFDTLENGVIVMGATNRPDIIDKALNRRFNTTHEITSLSMSEKEAFTKKYLDDVGIPYNTLEISKYCETAPSKQSELEKELIEKIINAIQNDSHVSL